MNRLALGVQALFTLLFIAVIGLIWFSMITQGWMNGRAYFYLGNLFCDLYMFIMLNILLFPAALLAAWRLLQMLGVLSQHAGSTFTNRVFVGMGAACFAVALYVMDPIGAAQAGQFPEPPSDERLEFPDLPLADDAEAAWEFTDLDGNTVSFADFEGKAIFLNFWATWCGFCIAEFPNIQRLYDAMKDNPGVVFVMMTNEERDIIERWLATEEGKKYDFPIYLTEDIPAQYRPTGWPTTFFIAPDGRTAFRHSGMVAWDGIKTQSFLAELAATGK